MCGITGIKIFNDKDHLLLNKISNATDKLKNRGPDFGKTESFNKLALGHRRLSIIDTSSLANQPFKDKTGRYSIVFNGEIFNYKQLKKEYLSEIIFKSESDTEVLLYLFIKLGKDCLNLLNGFFAFCIYDNQNDTLFVARDRFGVKPLYFYSSNDLFCFSSELKSLLQYDIPRQIDNESLSIYLHLNYIPAPFTIYKNISKLQPGYYIEINGSYANTGRYYATEKNYKNDYFEDYDKSKLMLHTLLDDAVKLRLVADVPVGCFLSGGLDSSIITSLAAKHKSNLETFSIGFSDNKFFDETNYAEMLSKKHNTKHHVFSLSNKDLYDNLDDFLQYIDEPFADSSALAVYMLSKYTRKHVTVALSGDGADELFAGYNKHAALFLSMKLGKAGSIANVANPLLKILPKSRNSKFSNSIRKYYKLSKGLSYKLPERYWLWAGYSNPQSVSKLLLSEVFDSEEIRRKLLLTRFISNSSKDFNEILMNDTNLLLQGDMLTKVDLMSMANSLEVRTPFLDYRVVNFAFSIPSKFKITLSKRKKILVDTFGNLLPQEIINRPKKGFEVPLLNWFRNELKSEIEEGILSRNFIENQGIFNYEMIRQLKLQLFSNNPDDATARIWGLIVFQNWWKNYHNKL